MEIQEGKFKGVYEICSETHNDNRGFISHAYSSDLLEEQSLNTTWVKEYHSYTTKKYTIRGLYIQLPPHVEGKLISAFRGEMMWVFVDLRKGSETFGQWSSVVLSEDQKNSIYLPKGFAHGCVSLSDDCSLYLKSDSHYSEANGVGIIWNDKDLNVNWRLDGAVPLVSEGHQKYGTFKEFKELYGGV